MEIKNPPAWRQEDFFKNKILLFHYRLEVFFTDAAERACPVIRQLFERSAGGYT
jgi:hypothetical protein